MSEILDFEPFFITHSGKVFKTQELKKSLESNYEYREYFGVLLSLGFEIEELMKEKSLLENYQQFRKYEKLIIYGEDCYLFQKINGKQVSKSIEESKAQQTNLQIDIYLLNLLQALYNLHVNGLLGRVFSTENVLENEKKELMFMDFGFGPLLYQEELYILAPPEIVFCLFENRDQLNPIDIIYDIKIDSWLLGAFLFHLIQKEPINKQWKYSFQDLKEYNNFFQKSISNGKTQISISNDSYQQSLKNLVQGLLAFDQVDRLSFYAIYKSEYVQGLQYQISDYQDKIKFYKDFETLKGNELKQKINLRENKNIFQILRTGDLVPQNEIHQYDTVSNISSSLPSVSSILESAPLNIFDLNKELLKNTELYFLKPKNSEKIQIQQICDFVNFESLRGYILCSTAYELQEICATIDFPFAQISQYYLVKMSFLIFQEMQNNLKYNSAYLQGFENEIKEQFQQWLEQNQIHKQVKLSLQQRLVNQYQRHGAAFQNNSKLDTNVKIDLEKDRDSYFIFKQSSQEFLKSSFRIISSILYKYFRSKIEALKYLKEDHTQYYHLLHKITFCHTINHLVPIDQGDSLLKLISIQSNKKSLVEQLYDLFQQKDNYRVKKEQITKIMQSYFP